MIHFISLEYTLRSRARWRALVHEYARIVTTYENLYIVYEHVGSWVVSSYRAISAQSSKPRDPFICMFSSTVGIKYHQTVFPYV